MSSTVDNCLTVDLTESLIFLILPTEPEYFYCIFMVVSCSEVIIIQSVSKIKTKFLSKNRACQQIICSHSFCFVTIQQMVDGVANKYTLILIYNDYQ